MPAPVISVVVPAHNAEATLAATLTALLGQVGVPDLEVIVVDSASTDGTRGLTERVAARDPRVHVRVNPGGEPAGSRNLGVAAARAERIAFTDADCVPEPGWLAAGLAALEHADLVQGRVLPAGPHRLWDRTLSVGHESGLYETANLFLHRDWVERAGGFAPLPGFGEDRPFGEDTWLAWRARRRGARTAFCAEAVVRHAVFARRSGAYLAEQRRRGWFCALVREVPELREAFLYRRWFLSRSTALCDLALAGSALAAGSRRRAPLLAALPYLATLPRRAPRAAVVQAAGDLVGAGALLTASLRTRTPVL
ncbi:MAG TPA: glycosyltransferase family 2 protein [Solirubrobacteraceae bacterium]|nr:glycosyltransferase family 2 protein [Solirubrobacteraceae bacterium]